MHKLMKVIDRNISSPERDSYYWPNNTVSKVSNAHPIAGRSWEVADVEVISVGYLASSVTRLKCTAESTNIHSGEHNVHSTGNNKHSAKA